VALESENYIDLGVLVHSKEIVNELTFDINLKRLVDWDFILNITKNIDPIYIPKSVITYNDVSDSSRISIKESYSHAVAHLKSKHKLSYKVSAVIIAFNHGVYLENAIESACQQIVNFDYEVIVFDDSSSDDTWHIISKMAGKYPKLIKGCRNISNLGQALNFKNAIGAARSDFIAVLEGDDIWTDNRKVQKQAEFLISNPDASMVFSKILVQNTILNTERYLKRQDSISKKKLFLDDFIADKSMNLIGTFSTCMFRRYVLSALPDFVYQERLSEITVAFHSMNYGPVGYLDTPMTVYRQHENGLWSGAAEDLQHKMWIKTREMAAKVVQPKFKNDILKLINTKLLSGTNCEQTSENTEIR
jgi:glycosyltransferase involved in cell wall biosynthesis